MPKTPFDKVWLRIVAREGESFYTKGHTKVRTKRLLEFYYEIEKDGFFPSRTRYRISKSDFIKAYEKVPIEGPGRINNEVRGSSYVWSVLHDPRISMGEW